MADSQTNMEKIDAIILAGGKGTRLRSVVSDIPKPLAPVNGRPFLDILLSQLDSFDCINKAVLAVGYKSEIVIERYKDCKDYKFEIVFSLEKELLGTGGAIKKAVHLTDSEDILVLNGDSYAEVDINEIIKVHTENNALITMVLKEVNDAGRFGSVRLNAKNRITFFEEKKDTSEPGLINAGIYLMKKKLFDRIEDNKVISLEKDILPGLIHKGIYGYIATGKFIDIGIPETYMSSGEYLREVA